MRQEALPEDEQAQQQKESEVGSASGTEKWDAMTPPALRKLTLSGNIPSMFSSRSRYRKVHTSVLLVIGEAYGQDDGEETLAHDDGSLMAMQATPNIPELIGGWYDIRTEESAARNVMNNRRPRRQKCVA